MKEDLHSIPLDWQADWQGSKCKFRASLKQDNFEANGVYEHSKPWYGLQTPILGSGQKKEGQKEYIKYVGKVNGYCIKYKFWVSEEESPNIASVSPKGSGLMIVDDNLQRIRVYIQGSRDNSGFSEMAAINDSDTPN